jgi:hypothetical protein
MINEKNVIRQLESCFFTCINPELAKEAVTTIKFLSRRLDEAEQCIYDIEDALDRGNDNDWAREAIAQYEERNIKQYF